MNKWDDPDSEDVMPTRNLYEILGIDENATDSQIKKAYFEIARVHHPDKRASNPTGSDDTYKEAGHAYRVLSDPDKRKIYDLGGDQGLEEHEGLANINVDTLLLNILMWESGQKMCLLCVLFLFVLEAIILPLLVMLQLDGSLGWSWFGVTTPMWIPLGLAAPVFLCAPFAISKQYSQAGEDPAAQMQAKASCVGCVVLGFMVGSLAASAWMLCYKLDGANEVSYSYLSACIPLFLLEGATALPLLQICAKYSKEECYEVVKSLLWKSLRVSFYVLLALKLDGMPLSWIEVMFPLITWPVVSLCLMARDVWEHKKLKSKSKAKDVTLEEEASRYAPFLFALKAVLALGLLLFVVLVLLSLTGRLSVSYSVSALPYVLSVITAYIMVVWALLCFTPSGLQGEYQQFHETADQYGTFQEKEASHFP